MKSWTRTLTLADAHSLLVLAQPRMSRSDWERACYKALAHIKSRPRQTDQIRLARENFLVFTGDSRIDGRGLFLRMYRKASAAGQEGLVRVAWALSHDITAKAVEELVAPALASGDQDIPLMRVDKFVKKHAGTEAADALRKTRTTLLDALSGLGCVETRGTGRHRSITATQGHPDATVFSYLILRELDETNRDAMSTTDATTTAQAVQLTQCNMGHAFVCIGAALQTGSLIALDNEIAVPEAAAA